VTRPFAGDQILDADLGDEIKNFPPQLEVGRTGLKRSGGYVQDEFLPQLRGRQAIKVYREMSENSPVLGAWLYTVTQLLRQIEWRVEPASDDPNDKAIAEFVEECLDDLDVGFADVVSEACTCLTYGWSLNEIVYKRRMGMWAPNPMNRSKHADGRMGWRKFSPRTQDSMLRWVFSETGEVLAMVQMPAPRYQRITLPMKRCLLFRPQVNKGSPEGKSLLRTAYRPWFMIKRLEEIEAIGAERDLAGLPVAYVPPNVLNPRPGSDEAKMLQAVKQAVTAVRRNEQDGLVWPLSYDDDRNLQYDFKLLASGGSRQFNIDGIIERYETRMLMSVMADFIMTGHENNGGSYALHTDKSGIFRTGVNGIAKAIADPINRKAIPQLLKLNGIQPEKLPKLVPSDVDPPDLTQLAQFIMSTASAGMTWFPDGELEKFIRDAARLPQQGPDITAAHDQAARDQAVMQLAQMKMQGLQMEQQAAQGEQQIAGTAQDQDLKGAQFVAGRQDAADAKKAEAKKTAATNGKAPAKKGKS
jgi:hypothetical protein